jgi:tRNA modification GTPase
MERSRRWTAEADLVVVCVPSDVEKNDPSLMLLSTGLVVRTKSDLRSGVSAGDLAVSALTGEGLDELRVLLAQRLFGGASPRKTTRSEPLLTRGRHREGVARALVALTRAEEALASREPVLAASSLREAADALLALIGATNRDDVFDRVFAGFCIGK